jgi:hypothetical protein
MVPETGGKVWRFLFSADLIMGALLVLFAGALVISDSGPPCRACWCRS